MMTKSIQLHLFKKELFVIIKSMNSITIHRLKILFITFGIFFSIFTVFIWVFGPIQAQSIDEDNILNTLYSQSAFNDCTIIQNTQVNQNAHLIECKVNETSTVWLMADESVKIIKRYSWNQESLTSKINTLKSQYHTELVSFSVYNDHFVFNVKNAQKELFINLDKLIVEMSIKR